MEDRTRQISSNVNDIMSIPLRGLKMGKGTPAGPCPNPDQPFWANNFNRACDSLDCLKSFEADFDSDTVAVNSGACGPFATLHTVPSLMP